MGRKGDTETLAIVLLAFVEQRTWRQSELARRAGVERKQIARVLQNLEQAGLPLEREEEHPYVYWSVPKNWLPGAVAFSGEDVGELVRILQLAPKSQARDHLLTSVSALATGVSLLSPDQVITQKLTPAEETCLATLQQSLAERRSLRARYYTLSRGDVAWRYLSVHRILVEERRFIATCHRENRLKWFRLDGVISAELRADEPHRPTDADTLERFYNESFDGYHSGAPAIRCTFRVALADARWVSTQLPLPCHIEHTPTESLFSAVTAGLLPLARFLVGLGRAATIDTPELKALVVELARGALGDTASDTHSQHTEHLSGGPNELAE